GDRLEAAGLTYSLAGENLALAATITQAHDGLMGSPGHRENILRPEFRRVGVAVVSGPLGLMTVQVFTG
ncbi:MAG: rane protein, partial [Acidobacteria bacterium]|nr:rane protein [Acidobacteriota bacterium]